VSARTRALVELTEWHAPSEAQEALRTAYVDHLRAHDDALSRSCFPHHLTAGTLVVSSELDAVLLNLHRKAGRWFHFGGHVEPDDASLYAAAAREAAEESGLARLAVVERPVQLSRHTVSFCDPRGPVDHLDVRYAGVAPSAASASVSEESLDVRWWPLDGLPPLADEMHELIELSLQPLRADHPSAPSSRAPVE
jgi:8-oxo-dGTP pyrophosphatase MutT (NUDIX family)